MQNLPKDALESNSYQEAKEVLFNEVNGKQVPYQLGKSYYAPTSSMPHSSRIHHVNRMNFKKPKGENELIKEFKKELGKSRNHKFQTIAHFII